MSEVKRIVLNLCGISNLCTSDTEANAVLCIPYFMQNIIEVFQNAIKLLESDKVTSTEIHDLMIDLKMKLWIY